MPSTANADRSSLRTMLRESTRTEHEAVDRSLSRLDLTDGAPYRRFLRIHLDALTLLAARCGANDRADIAEWIDCLHGDLSIERSGVGTCERLLPKRMATPFADIGVAYVARGSRLGAAVLLKRVGAGFPTRYLAHRPAVPWRTFVERLDGLGRVADVRQRMEAVESARAAFSVFALAGPPSADRP